MSCNFLASIAREFLAVNDLHDRPMVQGEKLQDSVFAVLCDSFWSLIASVHF
jgi:hypothetical protein